MPKLVLDFATQEELNDWQAFYFDGGGEQEMMECFAQNDQGYPDITFSEPSDNPYEKVTRLEIIDYRSCPACDGAGTNDGHVCDECGGARILGRTPIFHNPRYMITPSIQDDDKTLKIFIDRRVE